MEKKMETTILHSGNIGFIGDNGTENGNYQIIG